MDSQLTKYFIERKSRFIPRERREVNKCICLKGRKGAIDGVVKCFCEKDKDIKCEYCRSTEHLKCYCESADAACICKNFCSFQCNCFCHGDLPISVKNKQFNPIENIKTILLDDINSFFDDSLDNKSATCSCNSLCDGCKCVCHNEEEKKQASCACNPIDCQDDCKCDCHPQVLNLSCDCNIECPIGCKCSVGCSAGIYCLNACLSSCSCKCHIQEEPVCACSSSCDDKCKCGCHQSTVECQKECYCGCHLQCKNEK